MRQKPQNTVNSYRFIFSKVQLFLAFSSNFRSSALDILGFVLNLLSLGAWCSLLGGRGLGGGLLCFLGGSDSLFPLGFANLRLLVPFCHDILEGGSNNGALELLSSLAAFLGGVFFQTLLVLTPIENSPSTFPGVPLEILRPENAHSSIFIFRLFNKATLLKCYTQAV